MADALKHSFLVIEPDSEIRATMIGLIQGVFSESRIIEAGQYSLGLTKAINERFDAVVIGAGEDRAEVLPVLDGILKLKPSQIPRRVLLNFKHIPLILDPMYQGRVWMASRMHEKPGLFSSELSLLLRGFSEGGAFFQQRIKSQKASLVSQFFEMTIDRFQERLGAELVKESLALRQPNERGFEIGFGFTFRMPNLAGSYSVSANPDFFDAISSEHTDSNFSSFFHNVGESLLKEIFLSVQEKQADQSNWIESFFFQSFWDQPRLYRHCAESGIMVLKLRAGSFRAQVELCFRELPCE